MKRFKDILCVVDPEADFNPALDRAVSLAANNQACLKLMSVVEPVHAGFESREHGLLLADYQASIVNRHEEKLSLLAESCERSVTVDSKVVVGKPFLQIIQEVLRHQHDLVVKTSENTDWLDRSIGNDDLQLLRKCPCPVWLVQAEAPKAYRCILAAVDASDFYPARELQTRKALNETILEIACSLALSQSSELHVVFAWDAAGESAMRGAFIHKSEEDIAAYVEKFRLHNLHGLNTLLNDVRDSMGPDALNYLEPIVHLPKGRARKEIPSLAKQINADLIVMGTVARTGIPGFIIGNTAETILRLIDSSVLAIKPPGFLTPVTLET